MHFSNISSKGRIQDSLTLFLQPVQTEAKENYWRKKESNINWLDYVSFAQQCLGV